MKMGSGPSPPRYPLANSFSKVLLRCTDDEEGANAEAEAKSVARTAADFIMVEYIGSISCNLDESYSMRA